MSRAFVKDSDDDLVAGELPERPLPPHANYVTAHGLDQLHARVRELNEEVRALGEMTPPPDTEIATDPHLALYHLGSLAPLGPADRQRMLDAPTLGERLGVFAAALDDAAAVVRFRSA